MKCPACSPPQQLVTRSLEPGLTAHQCDRCGGAWLRPGDYATWRATAPASAEVTGVPMDAKPAIETGGLRRCPDCNYLLGRYRVGHGAGFHVDRCGQCNGTWFDRAEWGALRDLGLARALPTIFSDEWQREVRRAEQAEAQERRFAARLGEEDLARAREFRAWLDGHPKRAELLAYLELLPAG